MDTELITTFLEVVACKSFISAARRLNVAQTTVSARIRTLEAELGQCLLVRHKGGTTLTPAGEQLMEHAPEFVKLWRHMQRQIGVPKADGALTIGAEVNLWQPLVPEWARLYRRRRPDIALRMHVDVREDLINHVSTGLMDIAVMYAPPQRPDLKTDLLLDERLVLVTIEANTDPLDTSTFISMDWGPEFAQNFNTSFPDAKAADLSTNLGPLAFQYLLKNGGSGYFRMGMVTPFLATGNLHLAVNAPQFSYPIQAVSRVASDHSLLAPALACLKDVVADRA